jgi:hypothetical protein
MKTLVGATMKTFRAPIESVDLLSVARITGLYYCIAGWLGSLTYLFTDSEKVYAPLGFLIPVLGAKLDFTWARPKSFLGLLLTVMIVTILYAVTGWLSGLVCGTCYNLFSRRLGMQINGSVDTQKVSGPFDGPQFLDSEK